MQLPNNGPPATIPDDEHYEFEDHDPTLDDAVRLWHDGIAQKGEDTVAGTVEFAGILTYGSDSQRGIWLESIRLVRAAGLFDADTSAFLMHEIVNESFEWKGWLEDPEIYRMVEEMHDICVAHGLGEDEDFSNHPNPPAEWTRLNRAADDRERELIGGVLREAGEAEVARELCERPEEFAARMEVVRARIARELEESRRRRGIVVE